MDNIIVTVRDSVNLFSMDVELPVDIKINKLKKEINKLLKSSTEYSGFVSEKYSVFCERLNCILDDEDTPNDVGISNGDLLVLI